MREPEKVTAKMVQDLREQQGYSMMEAKRLLVKKALMQYAGGIDPLNTTEALEEIKLVLLKLIEGG